MSGVEGRTRMVLGSSRFRESPMLTLYRLLVIPAACAIAVSTALPAFAQDAEAAVRAGDTSMTCEAIIAEINTLTAAQAETAQRAEGRARAGRGFMNFARGALSAAAPMLAQGAMGGMSDGMSSAVTQMAIQQAQTQAMTAALSAGQPTAEPAPPAPAAQSPRVQHLNGLLMQRGC